MKRFFLCLCLAVVPEAAGSSVSLSSSTRGPTVFDTHNQSFVPNGNLLRVGTLTVAGDPASFVEFGTGAIRNAGIGPSARPGKVHGSVANNNGEADDAPFNGMDVYVWIYNAPSVTEATQRGLFRTGGLTFPVDDPAGIGDTITISSAQLTTYVPDPVLGAQGRFDPTEDDFGTGRFVLGDLTAAPVSGVKINEWMADNQGPSGLPDPADGSYPDWFELYNPKDQEVDLSGWQLTNLPELPGAFTIPAGFKLPAHGYLLVWADGQSFQNNLDLSRDLHADFLLNNSGGRIRLSTNLGAFVHEVTYGRQVTNISQGRIPDGSSAVDFLSGISPGQPNTPGIGPPVLHLTVNAQERRLTLLTLPGSLYQIEATNNLENSWHLLLPFTEGTGAPLEVLDPDNSPSRFYRAARKTP
jgi:hypothetical protein